MYADSACCRGGVWGENSTAVHFHLILPRHTHTCQNPTALGHCDEFQSAEHNHQSIHNQAHLIRQKEERLELLVIV